MSRPCIKDHGPDALRDRFRREGLPAYRADQVLAWVYGRGVLDPEAMTNLDKGLRARLAESWDWQRLRLTDRLASRDGTRKLVFGTPDGHVIESVLIPEERRLTLCLSTQVGCPLACSFCATGSLGLARNLTTAEIVDQVTLAREQLEPGESLTNVVFMGMGEPLLNWPAVRESIAILTHPKALAMAPRRVTVSTSGVVPRIHDVLEAAPVNLAVSLHATTDEVRDVLVPLNKRFPIDVLLASLRDDPLVTRRRPVFFEYTLMAGVNDSPEDARRLARLLRDIPSKLNAIPMNPHADAPYRPPSDAVVDRFTAAAHAEGLRVTLRRNRGRDIDAACGQLAARQTRTDDSAGVGSGPPGGA